MVEIRSRLSVTGRQEGPETKKPVSADFEFGHFRASKINAESCVGEPQRTSLHTKISVGPKRRAGAHGHAQKNRTVVTTYGILLG